MQLPPFKLERYFAKYEFNTQYLLCSSDCESMTVAELLALEPDAAEKFQSHWLGYTESPGSLSLRQAICGLYENMQPESILVHAGAEEAIFLFMNAALEARVRELREESHHGASWVARHALEALVEAVRDGEDRRSHENGGDDRGTKENRKGKWRKQQEILIL